MNQNIRSGSPAPYPARPKNNPARIILQASSKTRVTARPPNRANQPRHSGGIAYVSELGRDIDLSGAALRVGPDFSCATHLPDHHTNRKLFLRFSRVIVLFPVGAARIFLISNPHQTPDFLRDFDFFDFYFQTQNTDQKSSTTINQ